jgi:hypothetical protein
MTFQIRATNYIELEDVIQLKLPRPLHFTGNTTCFGDGFWAKGDLRCNVSGDLLTVDIAMSINGRYLRYRRNLEADGIDA